MALPRAPQRQTPAFAFSFVERAIREGIGLNKFRAPEMAEVVRFFYGDREPECVYCGDRDVRRWDHVVPVARGGDTVLGNMVPACARCDDSKQATVFEQWMTGGAPLSPVSRGVGDIAGRVRRIRDYAGHYGYKPQSIEQRLGDGEREELQAIRRLMEEGRRRLERLISDHRARVRQ
ncbi:MAG: HNH endonuclease [Dehalococcoidia bacterium]|jgi:hypothetical protein|nr:HNH endonuclease [Dehalococcoidia bacterium]MDP6228997.1 HNH endonuclease [Dehalococcoidia bacterium]MDP7082751.1 HNH endonuclease [Dehalococcoidia bacterium]MDP7200256.1 HNH endonuclease [Dehalococcoidia bacterium]MDP7509629.1 HNH endonuclease [Dehalococcoidia bacterium]